jgi:Flp pilus assembly protein TadD
MLAVVVLCIGGIVWMRRRRWQAYTKSVSPQAIPSATLALHAFAHGNSCLAAGKFAEAIAAFHQARELEPKHPHVAGRLAEVERRQQAASATPLVNATI